MLEIFVSVQTRNNVEAFSKAGVNNKERLFPFMYIFQLYCLGDTRKCFFQFMDIVGEERME